LKVLIIEDAPDIVESISLCFELRWPEAEIISTPEGGKGLTLAETESPDVIILDLGLPDMDGLEVLKGIRSLSNVPIIIVTVRGDEIDRVRGLELGADDYITKPFSHIELLARVHAVLRRAHMAKLVLNEGTVLTHRALLEKVWGEEYTDAHEYLKVYIQRLRDKLEVDPANPQLLINERGVGYKFVKPSSA